MTQANLDQQIENISQWMSCVPGLPSRPGRPFTPSRPGMPCNLNLNLNKVGNFICIHLLNQSRKKWLTGYPSAPDSPFSPCDPCCPSNPKGPRSPGCPCKPKNNHKMSFKTSITQYYIARNEAWWINEKAFELNHYPLWIKSSEKEILFNFVIHFLDEF